MCTVLPTLYSGSITGTHCPIYKIAPVQPFGDLDPVFAGASPDVPAPLPLHASISYMIKDQKLKFKVPVMPKATRVRRM